MKLRNMISIGLGVISLVAVILASAIPDSIDSFKQEIPFYVTAIVTAIIAIILYYWVTIRRFTYPALICMWAWLYEHKLAKSEFSSHTYRVYVFFGSSYKKLYSTIKDAFDQYLEDSNVEA